MWLVIMTTAQQWLVGLLVPTVISITVGYGGFQYGYGGISQKLIDYEDEINSMKPLFSKIPILESDIKHANNRIDTFEAIVVNGQKEQRQIANKILDEMATISKDNAVNSTRIGAIEVNVSEIKKRLD